MSRELHQWLWEHWEVVEVLVEQCRHHSFRQFASFLAEEDDCSHEGSSFMLKAALIGMK